MNSQQSTPRRFMVALTFEVPEGQQQAMAALIPQEQAHTRALAAQGRVEALHVSTDRARVWIVMRSDSPDDVARELTTFPLYPYMRPEVIPLVPL